MDLDRAILRPPSPRKGQSPTRVLVVEHDPARRATLAGWLQAMPNVTVVAVSSAREAMACERPQTFGLCLLCHDLAEVDGLTLGAMIRSVNAEARLVLVREDNCPRTVSLAFEHGFAAVVERPVAWEQLARLVAG